VNWLTRISGLWREEGRKSNGEAGRQRKRKDTCRPSITLGRDAGHHFDFEPNVGLPQQSRRILGEGGVSGDDGHVLDDRLANEKPIHGVLVKEWETGGGLGVTQSDRQFDETVRANHRRYVSGYRSKLGLLAGAEFRDELPRSDGADKFLVLTVFDGGSRSR
jgi:hypothetical protein